MSHINKNKRILNRNLLKEERINLIIDNYNVR